MKRQLFFRREKAQSCRGRSSSGWRYRCASPLLLPASGGNINQPKARAAHQRDRGQSKLTPESPKPGRTASSRRAAGISPRFHQQTDAQSPDVAQAFRGVLLETAPEHPPHVFPAPVTDPGPSFRNRRQGIGNRNLPGNGRLAVTISYTTTPKRPNIRALIHHSPASLLRAHIAHGAHNLSGRSLRPDPWFSDESPGFAAARGSGEPENPAP